LSYTRKKANNKPD